MAGESGLEAIPISQLLYSIVQLLWIAFVERRLLIGCWYVASRARVNRAF